MLIRGFHAGQEYGIGYKWWGSVIKIIKVCFRKHTLASVCWLGGLPRAVTAQDGLCLGLLSCFRVEQGQGEGQGEQRAGLGDPHDCTRWHLNRIWRKQGKLTGSKQRTAVNCSRYHFPCCLVSCLSRHLPALNIYFAVSQPREIPFFCFFESCIFKRGSN